ncbi:hypothetical protein SAMN02745704_02142 [Paucidesulfovibrio gracilis DSM 16080]|uniref:Lipoprotein n=1 Tax=Paucidesulfovibrio gracilis DSM 16080 TaxID=1121449 RepID=A0A1T4XIX8_9BACT|nr:hypothetical protein [Paucidesulfovibrio gracilis]SKA89474.1 hypothetical protein SAMN02745704_02142 [Paucidesulfovibrio gracilis DSM 16080]
MKKICLLLMCLAVFLVSGCAGTLPVNSYEPQNIVRCQGKASIDEFTYAPFERGEVSEKNQIHNTALGNIYISTDVAQLVRRATALELEKTGIALTEDAPYAVEGEVTDFVIDDLGYSVDWEYAVTYSIRDKSTNALAFQKTFRPEPVHSGKFGRPSDFSQTVSEIILSGYNMFIHDQGALNLLRTDQPEVAEQ